MSGLLQKIGIDNYVPQVLPSSKNVNSYWDQWLGRRAVKLTPGQFCVSSTEDVLVTVLGSTAALCVRDSSRGLMGMVHVLLPTAGLSKLDERARKMAADYGHYILTNLINGMTSQGCSNEDLEALVVGGGLVWKTRRSCSEDTVDFVREFLVKEKIKTTAEYIGTDRPRKVYFSDRDDLPVIRVLGDYSSTIKDREDAYLRGLFSDWLLPPRYIGLKGEIG